MLKNLSVKTDRYSVLTYGACLFALFFLCFAGQNGEPFALPMLYACLMAECNPLLFCVAYALCGFIGFTLNRFFIFLAQALFLFFVFFFYRRASRTPGKESVIYIALAVAIYCVFGELSPYAAANGVPMAVQRAVLGSILLGASLLFSFGLRTVLKKSFRCRMSTEELICIAACFVLVGIGFYRAVGSTVSRSVYLFCILLSVFCLKNASVFAVALLFSLPEAAVEFSAESCSVLLVYACAAFILSRSGRLSQALGVFLVYALIEALGGLYRSDVSYIVWRLVAGFLPCAAFLCIPDFLLARAEEKLVFYRERQLSRIAINRNRSVTGEKLFEISGIFREIEAAFDCISKSGGEEKARLFIRNDLIASVCTACPDRKRCHLPERQTAFDRLIAVGCAKGKANFIDLPSEFSSSCSNPGGMLFALNRHIVEYKNYMIETENANAGRKLLSEQAKGVSDILKAMAIEQSEPLEIYSDREREISQLLARSGILCTEILVYGEGDNVTVSLITFGDADGKKIASLIGKALSVPCMPAEKMPLGDEKYCCTFRKKPRYDAAFGVASLAKEGENVCGDTYSVIKIDEKTFLVALSDGMGSGEYARKLSDSTISLIESFYRTKMPAETILETVNQLLSFNREEGFVCLDIAAVNLESGEAEIIKIGSPMGFIINRDKIRLLSGETLPLGILDNMRPITAKTGLAEDDILVFLSDGVTAAFGSDTDLVAFLQTLNPRNPQSLADALVNEARRLYGDKTPDDMTALAVRMYESA